MLFEALSRLVARQQPAQVAPDGARLTRCGNRCWVADRELLIGRHRLPIRMVVVEDPPGELTLYSPVDLDEGTIEALAGLGTVDRVIVPNRFHTLFAARASAQYPEAMLLVPAQLAGDFAGRAQTIEIATRVGEATELMPVSLREGLTEIVLYNDSAELLAVTDLLFNLHHGEGLQKLVFLLNGIGRGPALSRLQRLLLLKDAEKLAEFYRWAMSRPFSQISMAHGQVISVDAREIFYQLFHGFAAGHTGNTQ